MPNIYPSSQANLEKPESSESPSHLISSRFLHQNYELPHNNTMRKTQLKFLEFIFDKSANNQFIKSEAANERMAIYRETIMENLRKSISITYPGIWKLLGANCANAASYFFCKQKENLPSGGCIDFWGGKFPSFLGSRSELESLPYLEDYAKYEWLKHLSYISLSKGSVPENHFDSYNIEQMQYLKLTLQESSFLFTSNHPIDDIEQMLTAPDSKGFTLKEKPIYALITKDQTHWIGKGQYVFLKSLQNNTLVKAQEEALWQDKNFDLTNTFAMLFRNKLITKISLQEEKYV